MLNTRLLKPNYCVRTASREVCKQQLHDVAGIDAAVQDYLHIEKLILFCATWCAARRMAITSGIDSV